MDELILKKLAYFKKTILNNKIPSLVRSAKKNYMNLVKELKDNGKITDSDYEKLIKEIDLVESSNHEEVVLNKNVYKTTKTFIGKYKHSFDRQEIISCFIKKANDFGKEKLYDWKTNEVINDTSSEVESYSSYNIGSIFEEMERFDLKEKEFITEEDIMLAIRYFQNHLDDFKMLKFLTKGFKKNDNYSVTKAHTFKF